MMKMADWFHVSGMISHDLYLLQNAFDTMSMVVVMMIRKRFPDGAACS
jgi:hypothetical protein